MVKNSGHRNLGFPANIGKAHAGIRPKLPQYLPMIQRQLHTDEYKQVLNKPYRRNTEGFSDNRCVLSKSVIICKQSLLIRKRGHRKQKHLITE